MCFYAYCRQLCSNTSATQTLILIFSVALMSVSWPQGGWYRGHTSAHILNTRNITPYLVNTSGCVCVCQSFLYCTCDQMWLSRECVFKFCSSHNHLYLWRPRLPKDNRTLDLRYVTVNMAWLGVIFSVCGCAITYDFGDLTFHILYFFCVSLLSLEIPHLDRAFMYTEYAIRLGCCKGICMPSQYSIYLKKNTFDGGFNASQ